MTEMGGPVEDLIARGPISKYTLGEPRMTTGPVPEMLKNYMDVSIGVAAGMGSWADHRHRFRPSGF